MTRQNELNLPEWLVIVSPKEIRMRVKMKVVRGRPKGHLLRFPPGEFMFGRGPECDVRPNSALVSRQHCLLQITPEDAKVRDLGSINGTLINGQLVVRERTLQHGDVLQLGSVVLEVVIENDKPTEDISASDTVRQPNTLMVAE